MSAPVIDSKQVGGHGGALALLFENGLALKPNINPRELDFYRRGCASQACNCTNVV